MNRLEITRGIWLDCRKAVFLEEFGVLCVADLHLGYPWAQRHAGQLLPIREDDTPTRLQALCADYRPQRLAVLGDIIHRDVPHHERRAEIIHLVERISACSEVQWIVGNHDRDFAKVLSGAVGSAKRSLRIGNFLLAHGDERNGELRPGTFLVMGHEHPAISLGDGVRGARFPCFLCGPCGLILPAFSPWAAGTDIRGGSLMSPLAMKRKFTHAVAIMGTKLLRVPFTPD